MVLQIKRKFMRTKFYRGLNKRVFLEIMFLSQLPELNKVNWTNWAEVFFNDP